MRPESFEIKLLSNLHGEDLQIIKDYWLQTYTTAGDLKFANTAKTIAEQYRFTNVKELSDFVELHSCLELVDTNFECRKCHSRVGFKNRSMYKEFFKKGYLCVNCELKKNNKKAKDFIDDYKNILQEKAFSEFDFSYLEMIYIFLFLSLDTIGEERFINKKVWDSFYEEERGGANIVLQSLFDKRAIIDKHKDLNNLKEQISLFLQENSSTLSNEQYDSLVRILQVRVQNGIYLAIGEDVSNYELKIFVGGFIDMFKLNMVDIQQIENFVKNIRLQEIYYLIPEVFSKFPVPYEKNLNLETNLIQLSEYFDLEHSYSLLFYQAKLLAGDLFIEKIKDEIDHEKHKNKYSNKIASYIKYLVDSNKKPNYPKKLPDNWQFSQIEQFISLSFFDNQHNWAGMNTKEIISTWLSKVAIKSE
ncbi:MULTISPECIES: hypothetical protein [Acinetobacter]|uniref:hypothetical protein n=1 Tax=Acinetobacter TaxID=469 RepID=UPI001D0D297A|nr:MULTISPECIES: hypothetical protein [Acinetobacter]MDE3321478.1 hypothetical protein [Acinetobacter nosocomialis]MDQ9834618.1 hypothetical protein [Acinetobacter soli]